MKCRDCGIRIPYWKNIKLPWYKRRCWICQEQCDYLDNQIWFNLEILCGKTKTQVKKEMKDEYLFGDG